MKYCPLQPLDQWEADMWSAWDCIKAALDKQECIRTQAGQSLDVWIEKARPLWNFITECDAIVRQACPDRCSIVYEYWLTARGIEAWTPPTGGPLTWTPPTGDPLTWTVPGVRRTGEPGLFARKETKRQSVKDEIKATRTAHLKAYRAAVGAVQKTARREKSDGVVRTADR